MDESKHVDLTEHDCTANNEIEHTVIVMEKELTLNKRNRRRSFSGMTD